MNRSMITALVLMCLVSLCSGLRCYQCSGCEEGQRGHPVECSSGQSSCRKMVLGSRIEKSCSLSATCQFANVEKGLRDIFSDLSSSISGGAKVDAENTMINCCETDYCNSVSTITSSVLLLLPTLLLTALIK